MLNIKIGCTPLTKITKIKVPNNNTIWLKEEFNGHPNLTHYDRIYQHLFSYYELTGKIHKGKTHLIETSSGNAGTSFAWFAREYGYKCTVILPINTPKARVGKVEDLGAEIILSKDKEYMKSAKKSLENYLINSRKNSKNVFCFNHSQENQSVIAMNSCGDEIVNYLSEQNVELDYFISALGNGTSLTGIAQPLKIAYKNIKIIGFEPYIAPAISELLFPGKFENKYGIKPSFQRSKLIGTGVWGIDFPNFYKEFIDDIFHIKENEWNKYLYSLWQDENKLVGRTSGAALWSAFNIAETIENKNILIILYDSKIYYDD